ncbi:MAG: TolC family protein [Saprospirales bacterium]|nr:MAG: TolC family protein [Saprospirales bacterium]
MMKMVKNLLLAALIVLGSSMISSESMAQDTLRLNMNELLELAGSESPDLMIARIRYSNSYWQYQSFLADLRPQIELGANLPVLNRAIEPIVLPDGSEDFRSRSLMSNSLNVSLSQVIPSTGGQVFLSSGLRRIDLFSGDGITGSTSWLSSPVSLGINQPLFRFNQFKWNRMIEPLRMEESELAFSEELESIYRRAVSLFFDVITAQLDLEAARLDAENADTLYQLSLGRYDLGRIAETDLLQMELNLRNAEAQIARSTISLDIAMERLRDFLGIESEVYFHFELPDELSEMEVDPHFALEHARSHRSQIISFQRRLLESQSQLERAERNSGIDIQISGSIGFSQTADQFADAYRNLIDQEQLSVGISLPIADWGKSRARKEIARSQLELTERTIRQEEVNFERDILITVQQFYQVRQQVALSKQAMEITNQRLEITRNRYLIGKIGTLDLNLAITERESARRAYISALRSYWQTHFDLRGLTLYDFENRRSLVRDLDGF